MSCCECCQRGAAPRLSELRIGAVFTYEGQPATIVDTPRWQSSWEVGPAARGGWIVTVRTLVYGTPTRTLAAVSDLRLVRP